MKAASGKINHGDCIKGMAAMETGAVDLVFADPPFNIGYTYDKYDDRQDHEEYLEWSRDWMRATYRVLKPNGTFWLAIGDEYAAELKLIAQNALPGLPLLDEDAAQSAPVKPPPNRRRKNRRPPPEPTGHGFHCRSWVIWYYTFGVHCKQKFTRSHTHLFHFVKDPKDFTFNADAIRVPSARQLVYGDKRANPKGRMPDDTWLMPTCESAGEGQTCGTGVSPVSRDTEDASTNQNTDSATERRRSTKSKSAKPPTPTFDGFNIRPQDLPEGFTPESDTWYFSRVAGTFKERQGWHGCQMPEQLLGRIIKACSNEGDVVVDPFAGSGTTLVVAKKLGRKFAGFEVSEEYAKYARQRLSAAKASDLLDGAEEPLVSAPATDKGRSLRGLSAGTSGKKRAEPEQDSQTLFGFEADCDAKTRVSPTSEGRGGNGGNSSKVGKATA